MVQSKSNQNLGIKKNAADLLSEFVEQFKTLDNLPKE